MNKAIFALLSEEGATVVRKPSLLEIRRPDGDFHVWTLPWPSPGALAALRAWAAPIFGEVTVDLTEEEQRRLAGAMLVEGATGEVEAVPESEQAERTETSYTRAQLAAAVDEAHAALHEAEDAEDTGTLLRRVTKAHEALHSVGAGLPRVGCATPDPEAQAIYADLQAMRDRPLYCGHKVEDLIGGTDPKTGKPEVTKCGQCLADKQAEREAAPRTPEVVLRAMLRAYEAAALEAMVALDTSSGGALRGRVPARRSL